MNKDIIKGNWKQFKGEVQKKWGQLTDSELDEVSGDVTKLEGLIQKKCGIQKEQIRSQLEELSKKFS